MGRLSRRQK
uniref:Uncharacterized protein n=1 Tax=Anguilla anguilla TaxID=7936 RepID=A0A0E9QIU5_ANGAN